MAKQVRRQPKVSSSSTTVVPGVQFDIEEVGGGSPGWLIVETSSDGRKRFAGQSMAWSPLRVGQPRFQSSEDAEDAMRRHSEQVARLVATQQYVVSQEVIEVPLCPVEANQAVGSVSVRLAADERQAALSLLAALQQTNVIAPNGGRIDTIPSALKWLLREVYTTLPTG